MTEADRGLLMAEYAKLSEELLDLHKDDIVNRDIEIREYEKDHLLRCSFFADMLKDME